MEIKFDVNKLTIKIHNKIAIWNNSDLSSEEKTKQLKFLSHEIIVDVINEAFSEIKGVSFKEKTIASKPKRKFFFNKKNQ